MDLGSHEPRKMGVKLMPPLILVKQSILSQESRTLATNTLKLSNTYATPSCPEHAVLSVASLSQATLCRDTFPAYLLAWHSPQPSHALHSIDRFVSPCTATSFIHKLLACIRILGHSMRPRPFSRSGDRRWLIFLPALCYFGSQGIIWIRRAE